MRSTRRVVVDRAVVHKKHGGSSNTHHRDVRATPESTAFWLAAPLELVHASEVHAHPIQGQSPQVKGQASNNKFVFQDSPSRPAETELGMMCGCGRADTRRRGGAKTSDSRRLESVASRDVLRSLRRGFRWRAPTVASPTGQFTQIVSSSSCSSSCGSSSSTPCGP
jgi:hypothetical protein